MRTALIPAAAAVVLNAAEEPMPAVLLSPTDLDPALG